MLSCVHDGKVLDFHFKNPYKDRKYITNFYIGDIFIGQLFKMGKNKWTAICFHENASGHSARGFGSRYHAANYLLEINGFCQPEYRLSPKVQLEK